MNDTKKIEAVEDALDRLYEQLEELNGKEGRMTDSCVVLYKELLHGIKCGETVCVMKGGEEPEYSRRGGSNSSAYSYEGGGGGSYGGGSYGGDGGSYARKRNRMGRYSRDDGYSRHETGSLKMKLEELKDESPEEFRRLMEQLDG